MDMFSVLSEQAPWELKATYAFRIYDFNNDNVICTEDIRRTVKALTGWPAMKISFIASECCAGDRISDDRLEKIAKHVIAECDVISDGSLSYAEFEHMIIRSPDFISLFHVTI